MTTITINRAVVEQALEALEQAHIIGGQAACDTAITALRAALAQQAESPCACWPGRMCSRQAQCAADVREQQAEPNHDTRAEFERWAASYSTFCLEREDNVALGTTGYKSLGQTMLWHAWQAALAQQAAPDHETRAELAEQQVVQLAEERDHYRNLWQKAQQAKPATCSNTFGCRCPKHFAVEQAEPVEPVAEFDHGIGADRFKVVRGSYWWHILIGDSPIRRGKFHTQAGAEEMVVLLLREFRNGAFVQHNAPPQQAEPEPQTCTWQQDGDSESGVYGTSCGGYFNIEDGTPADNKMAWCCYCGKKLAQELITENKDD